VSGHVFHPGHEELHGITVVVEGSSGRAWVGRYHETTPKGVVLHDVSLHDPGSALLTRAAWIERLRKFGVRVEERFVLVPTGEAARITRLPDWVEVNHT
jgi:hypothetical protein